VFSLYLLLSEEDLGENLKRILRVANTLVRTGGNSADRGEQLWVAHPSAVLPHGRFLGAHGRFLGALLVIGYDRGVSINRILIHVPKGACPYNPPFVPTSRVALLSVDTGPLPIGQALPCFATRRRRRRCR
jgi:hypothetical protein